MNSRIEEAKMKIVGALIIAFVHGQGVAANIMSIRGSTKYSNRLMLSTRHLEDTNEEGNTSTTFMGSMSAKEARVFIAMMIIFGVAIVAGLSLIAYLLVKKRRKRKPLLKEMELLPSDFDEEVATFDGTEDNTVNSSDNIDNRYQAPEIVESGKAVQDEIEPNAHETSYKRSTNTQESPFISEMDEHIRSKLTGKC